MSNFTFKLPNGNSFEIKAPSGTNFEQAKAIFDQQAGSGGLAGFRVGDALSAATQAGQGLSAAQGQLSQSLGSLSGKLPAGADLNSLTATLGTAGGAAAGQLSSALTGSVPGISSTITGASTSLNSLVSGTSSDLPLAFNDIKSKLPAATEVLTGQAGQFGSLANQAVVGLSKSIGGVPTQGISVADFAKQGPALAGIGNLSKADVTGTLAQASKLVGQSSDQISNELGAGKFGFDATQLEKAGLVKPGTAAAFLSSGESDLTSVLKSPTVWTGKDGVKSLDTLLGNDKLQDKVQQGLMASGVSDLKSLGVPTDKLTPQALSGLATNAAKSVPDALKWATGTGAIPGLPNMPDTSALTPEVKAGFDAMATNGAFAVSLTQGKLEPELKQEDPVEPAEDTVNADSLDAAAARILGDDKIPDVIGNSDSGNAEYLTSEFVTFVDTIYAEALSVSNRVAYYERYNALAQQNWNEVNQEFITIKTTYNSKIENIQTTAEDAITALGAPDNAVLTKRFERTKDFIESTLMPLFTEIKVRLAALAGKIIV